MDGWMDGWMDVCIGPLYNPPGGSLAAVGGPFPELVAGRTQPRRGELQRSNQLLSLGGAFGICKLV